MGIACLLMANKLTDNCMIPVEDDVFPRKQLSEWEEKVCWKLKFMLNPPTYVDMMDGLLTLWNKFAKARNLWFYQLKKIE